MTRLIILGLIVCAAILVWATAGFAHDAPKGWSYPFSCCAAYDCREVPADWVEEKNGAYRIVPTDERLAFTDTRIKDSPDGEVHLCTVGGTDAGKVICLFIPPRAF